MARLVNINYGHNKTLMDNCKRLHDYSYFVDCVRKNLQHGYIRHDAVVLAVEECIEQGILEDVLVKHRTEVVDIFLTRFDKKMYEEALREEGRDEMLEKCEQLERQNEELAKDNEELAKDNEQLVQKLAEYSAIQKNQARLLKENGISYEVARKILPKLDAKEMEKIYKSGQ